MMHWVHNSKNFAKELEFLLHKLKFHEQSPRFVDANPDTAVTTQVHEGIIECLNLEKVSTITMELILGFISLLLSPEISWPNPSLCQLN